MARYTTAFTTPRAPDEAFGYLANFANAALWDPGVASAEREGSGDVELHEAFVLQLSLGGRTMPMRYVVTELDPPRKVVLRSETARLISLDTITVTPDAEGSRVTYDADLRLKGLVSFADPVLRLVFGRIGDKAAAGLRAAMDGHQVAA